MTPDTATLPSILHPGAIADTRINTGGKRVLIISTSAGTGHVRAAEALEKEFSARSARRGRSIHEDALKFTNKLFRDFYSTLYIGSVRPRQMFLGWVYGRVTSHGKARRCGPAGPAEYAEARQVHRRFDPHITVCTHFMPASIISHLMETGQLKTHLSIVVTDLDCHAMWLSRASIAISWPSRDRAHLEALGLPRSGSRSPAFPSTQFSPEPVDKAAVRAGYGLEPDRTTLLLSAGASGVGPTEFDRRTAQATPARCRRPS